MDDAIEHSILHSCAAHAKSSEDIEACGVVLNFSPKIFYPLQNILKSPNSFELNARVHMIRSKVFCIFHSHPFGSAYPSDLDVACAKSIGIPYLIYSLLYDNFIYFDLKKCIPIKA
jgi:proteasome lid subunit RPN8/RPN11